MELPLFYTEKMKKLLKDEFEDYIKSFDEKAESGIRINTLKISAEEFKNKNIFELRNVSWCKNGFYCSDDERPAKNYLYHAGLFYIQEPSAMSAAEVLPVKEGYKVLDLCAAPGGKTLHIADRLNDRKLNGGGKIISCDLTDAKTALIKENVERNGFENVSVVKNDALVFKKEWEDTADIVIADLPCSGLGVIGKKCDIKYKTSIEDINALSEIQREILKNVSRYLKKGGQLLYSTCTIAMEENEDNVRWMLENLPFKKADIRKRVPKKIRNYMKDDGYIQILPDMTESDGFFIAAFIKQ